MKRVVLALGVVLFVSACGGAKNSAPTSATLTAINVKSDSIEFEFKDAPTTVTAAFDSRPLASCGSGQDVPLRGRVHLVVHFRPAQTDLAFGADRRLPGQGPFLELAKVCDFEADLAWAIGFDKKRAYRIERHGSHVTVALT